MHLSPFQAIRPKPQDMKMWLNRQIDNYDPKIHDINDFMSLIQPDTNNSSLIRKRLDTYLRNAVLKKDPDPSLYFLHIETTKGALTGFIGCVHTDYLINGTIKPHEHVEKNRVMRFKKFLQDSKLNTEPVVICHKDNNQLSEVRSQILHTMPMAEFDHNEATYKLWRIDHPIMIKRVNKLMQDIDCAYIADGHHRCFSSLAYAKEKASKNHFLAYVVPENQLKISSFCRMFTDLNEMRADHFLAALYTHFTVDRIDKYAAPTKENEFTLYIWGSWYRLRHTDRNSSTALERIPSQIIYDKIAKPLLNIRDLQRDKRIQYHHYNNPITEIKNAVDRKEFVFGIQHYDISFKDIKTVISTSKILPPKSTHIEPKPLNGMLIFDFLSQ